MSVSETFKATEEETVRWVDAMSKTNVDTFVDNKETYRNNLAHLLIKWQYLMMLTENNTTGPSTSYSPISLVSYITIVSFVITWCTGKACTGSLVFDAVLFTLAILVLFVESSETPSKLYTNHKKLYNKTRQYIKCIKMMLSLFGLQPIRSSNDMTATLCERVLSIARE